VNKRLPSREEALQLLKKNKCPKPVISHCTAVTDYALDLAAKLESKGYPVKVDLVEAGGVLHDLGRCKTNTVEHGVVGGQFAVSLGLPDEVVNIIKRHVGAGITYKEAQAMGWPKDNYVPQTLEEKIVCYADKRIDEGNVVSIEVEIAKLNKAGKPEAAERVRNLHNELTKLLGNPL
jgi:uncharacterized protein